MSAATATATKPTTKSRPPEAVETQDKQGAKDKVLRNPETGEEIVDIKSVVKSQIELRPDRRRIRNKRPDWYYRWTNPENVERRRDTGCWWVVTDDGVKLSLASEKLGTCRKSDNTYWCGGQVLMACWREYWDALREAKEERNRRFEGDSDDRIAALDHQLKRDHGGQFGISREKEVYNAQGERID